MAAFTTDMPQYRYSSSGDKSADVDNLKPSVGIKVLRISL